MYEEEEEQKQSNRVGGKLGMSAFNRHFIKIAREVIPPCIWAAVGNNNLKMGTALNTCMSKIWSAAEIEASPDKQALLVQFLIQHKDAMLDYLSKLEGAEGIRVVKRYGQNSLVRRKYVEMYVFK